MKLSAVLMFCAALPLLADDAPKLPQIVGLSHIGLYAHDVEKSRAFYKDFLGFAEPYSVTNDDGSLRLTFIKINDRQAVELFPEKEAHGDRLYHIALITDDAVGMRDYLATHGVKVPDKVGKGRIGNFNYFIKDPDGNTVEIVQYLTNGLTLLNQEKFLPATRIAGRMPQVGILTRDLDAAKKFYEGILGLRESGRDVMTTNALTCVREEIPNAGDFIELTLCPQLPAPDKRGYFDHLCLEVPDIQTTKAALEQRAVGVHYTDALEIQTGINGQRLMNLYDPDGTRVELVESPAISLSAAERKKLAAYVKTNEAAKAFYDAVKKTPTLRSSPSQTQSKKLFRWANFRPTQPRSKPRNRSRTWARSALSTWPMPSVPTRVTGTS
jgi:lactoylglutathione lyase